MKKALFFRVEARALQQFGQVAGGEDEGIALLTRSELAPQFQSFFIRGRQGLGLAAAGLERRHDGLGLVGHGGQVDLAFEVAGNPVPER
jgi:hypothetical protein